MGFGLDIPSCSQREDTMTLAGSILKNPEGPVFKSQPCHFKLCDLGQVPSPPWLLVTLPDNYGLFQGVSVRTFLGLLLLSRFSRV